MTETSNPPRNYLKGIIRKKWYSWVFLAGMICFFISISSIFVNNLFVEEVIDWTSWSNPDRIEALLKWIGTLWNPGLLIMFYTYGNRLGLILIGISFLFGGLIDYTLPKEVRRSLVIALGIALGGYMMTYLFYVILYL